MGGKEKLFEARVITVRNGVVTLKWTYDEAVPADEIPLSDCVKKHGPSIYDAASSGTKAKKSSDDHPAAADRETNHKKTKTSSQTEDTCWGLGPVVDKNRDTRERRRERSVSNRVIRS